MLYVDDILLASSDVELLHETKRFLSSKFDMKYLGNASFVLVYRSIGIVQEVYLGYQKMPISIRC